MKKIFEILKYVFETIPSRCLKKKNINFSKYLAKYLCIPQEMILNAINVVFYFIILGTIWINIDILTFSTLKIYEAFFELKYQIYNFCYKIYWSISDHFGYSDKHQSIKPFTDSFKNTFVDYNPKGLMDSYHYDQLDAHSNNDLEEFQDKGKNKLFTKSLIIFDFLIIATIIFIFKN